MEDIVVSSILLAVSLFMFIAGIRSFLEKGFLFNNAYIYASKKERETMDKKPYYRQSAIVFFGIGITFLIIGLAILLNVGWMTYIAGGILLILVVYAVASGIAIEKRKSH